jgi:hypothetical protein
MVHIRRGIFNGTEITPKTDAGLRDVDIDDTLRKMLKDYIGERKTGRLFPSRKGTPFGHGNTRNRVLTPLRRSSASRRRVYMPSATVASRFSGKPVRRTISKKRD